MAKRNASQMTPAERDLVFEIVASNFNKGMTEARRHADDSEYFGNIEEDMVAEEASIIDPSLLPPAKKARVVAAFGESKFTLDLANTYLTRDKQWPTPGQPGVNGISFVKTLGTGHTQKTFVAESKFDPPGEDDDGDELVVIRIKTGKGGRQQFRVPKKVAKDMVGCD